MKYNTLKATFKNGMVSPRLRGREKEGDLTSSVEKIENFYIDKIGGAVKRGGIQAPKVQPFLNTNDASFIYDPYPIASSVDTTFFAVNLRGKEYIFRFNNSKEFNSINGTGASNDSSFYQSDWLTVINPTGNPNLGLGPDYFYQKVRPFAPYTDPSAPPFMINYLQWCYAAPYTQADRGYMQEYLNTTVVPTQMAKISDATVVFTSDKFSFTVTLTEELIYNGGVNSNGARQAVFLVLPYFVNVRQFVSKMLTTSSVCPVQPLNFPFNAVNTDTTPAGRADISVVAGQTGGATANGVLTASADVLNHVLRLTRTMVMVEGVEDPSQLVGKFISIPNATNVIDVVFFITKFYRYNGSFVEFFCLRVTGGTPEVNSTRWRVSTFGGKSHPRAVAYVFGRLMYGNAGVDESKWWASGVHPSNIANFQGFLGYSLLQDATSDVSGMLNEGIATPTISDQFRYGFVGRVPNLAPISFIESRRRIHFGTLAGECQLTIGNSGFAKYSYEEYIIRSNSASLFPATRGDGKIFYIANYGKDIRFISTEDKDYESIDGLITTGLEGLGFTYNKILWYEKLSAIIARTDTNRIFLMTLHEDTQIKAITEFVFDFDVVDYCISLDNLYFVYDLKEFRHVSKFLPTTSIPSDSLNEVELGGDIAVCYPSISGEVNYWGLYPFFLGETIYLFYNGVEYTIEIPSTYDGTPEDIDLPVDISAATVDNPAFFYGKKVTAKIKTMPISEGGGNDSAVGDVTRVDRVLIQVDNSGPFRIGNEGGTIYNAEGVQLSPLSTKYVKYDMPQSPDIENHLYIETDKPTPLNISGVAYRGVSNNGA